MTKDKIKNLPLGTKVLMWNQRNDKYEREFCGFATKRDKFVDEYGHFWMHMELIPEKKTRLMTPAELAGGWLVFHHGRAMIAEWHDDWVATMNSQYTVEEIRDNKREILGWSRTATGEIESVEVAE